MTEKRHTSLIPVKIIATGVIQADAESITCVTGAGMYEPKPVIPIKKPINTAINIGLKKGFILVQSVGFAS